MDERHARRGAGFDRTDADVRRYNAAAASVMREAGVPVHDLYWLVEQAGPGTMLGPDGTHFTPEGSDRLAEAVADCVARQLVIARYRPLPQPASGPEAAAAYRKAAAERDRQVPAAYRRPVAPEFRIPEDAAGWAGRRPGVLEAVRKSLGDLPARPSPPRSRVVSRELRRGYTLEKVALDNGVDGEVTSLLLIPEGRTGRVPAILWLHSSTPDKTQVIIPKTNGGEEPLGEVLVRAGYAVLAPDAYWHGDRAGTGPSGTAAESGRAEQEDLFKRHLWLGRTLWGMFVRDDQVALDYLCSRPEVDPGRIGATGMSMGSTRAWWLAAVDERVAAVVAVACLTRYQELMAHGELRAARRLLLRGRAAQALRHRGGARPDRPPAVPGADRRPRRGVARRRRQDAGADRRPDLRGGRSRGSVPQRPLPGGRPHLHAADAGRDAGLVRSLVTPAGARGRPGPLILPPAIPDPGRAMDTRGPAWQNGRK